MDDFETLELTWRLERKQSELTHLLEDDVRDDLTVSDYDSATVASDDTDGGGHAAMSSSPSSHAHHLFGAEDDELCQRLDALEQNLRNMNMMLYTLQQLPAPAARPRAGGPVVSSSKHRGRRAHHRRGATKNRSRALSPVAPEFVLPGAAGADGPSE